MRVRLKTGMNHRKKCSGSRDDDRLSQQMMRVIQRGRVWIAVVLLWLLANPATASLLWQLEKNGTRHYLLGTIHIADADIIALPPHVEKIVQSSRQLIVEAIADDQSRQSIADRSLLASNTLKNVLGPELFDEVSGVVKRRGIPPASVVRLKPWAVGLMLNVPTPSLEPVLDVHLQYRFQDSGRAVYALETIDEQLEIFDRLSMQEQIEFLKSSLAQLEDFDANFAYMKTLYLAGDLDAIHRFSEQQSGKGDSEIMKQLMVRILDERNHRMFARLQPYLAQSGTLIAVGALHLPGSQGLLSMFRQAGFTVTPLNP